MDQKLNILLLEDVTSDAALVLHELSRSGLQFASRRVDTQEEFLEELKRFDPHVILADYSLPQFTAIDALRLLKERGAEVPLILVTGSHSDEVAVECLREGADDYILKGALRRLPTAVVNAVRKKIGERERRAAREALRRSEEQYRLIADNTRDLISMVDLEGTILYASPSHEAVLGYAPTALLARNVTEFLHPEDGGAFQRTLDEARFFREARRGEVRWRNAIGQWHVFDSAANCIFDEQGRPQRALIVSRDTSDRKRAEQEIRKLAAFARYNPNPVLEFSAEGALTYHNEAAGLMAKSLGKSHPEAILPLNTPNVVKMCLISGQNKLHLKTVVTGRTLSWSFFPIMANQVVHCYAEDISQSLNLEAQLRQVQKMESVGQLAAGVAHDFNNLLTVIQGHVGLMLAEAGTAASLGESARQISAAAERAGTLTRQLLMFSRKQTIQAQLLDLNDVVENVLKMLRTLVGEQVKIVRELAASVPPIHADAGMMEQVLVNLAVNARDAMQPNGGTVTLSTSVKLIDDAYVAAHAEARPGYFVGLTVTDTGHGMDAATLGHIFEPFFTTKEIGKGTGLGLATVYGIVKQHQGWVEVQSTVGKGTAFTVYLPISTKARPKAAGTGAGSIPGGNETILVVEDEAPLRELVQEILQKKGYTVLDAATGAQALKVWQQHKESVHLLLTDLMMPEGISGRQLADMLSAEKPNLKVIYTSGYNVDVVSSGFVFNEGINFLQKPYQPEALTQIVRASLDGGETPAG
jgi:two-component system, cell cycle sensor histidine kinase and response regulator CckA